jgi:hypothetical protein
VTIPAYVALWPDAVCEAALRWYPEAKSEIERLVALREGFTLSEATMADSADGALAWFAGTVQRLRDCFFAEQIAVHYSVGVFGYQPVPSRFWSSPEAIESLLSGRYWPNGIGMRQPSYPLVVLKADFEALLRPEPVDILAPSEASVPPTPQPGTSGIISPAEIDAFLRAHPNESRKEQQRHIQEQYPGKKLPRGRWREAVRKDRRPPFNRQLMRR